MPDFCASFASTTPWFSSLVVNLNTLSPSIASAGAVEQHETIIMSLASEYALMLRMLELVSGPIITSTPRALSAVSLSSAITGLVAESSPISLRLHCSPCSSRYSLKSDTPIFAASMFSSPWLASSPVSGKMYPMVISPDSLDSVPASIMPGSCGVIETEAAAAMAIAAAATAAPMIIVFFDATCRVPQNPTIYS